MRRDDKKLENRVLWMARNKIQHLMPTMSPAPKSETEIESVKAALEYYARKGVLAVQLEVKHMGSYCDVYLFKDINQTKFFSRNGYLINFKDKDEMLEMVKELHQDFSDSLQEDKPLIVGGELMPWSYLGQGLIDKEYQVYYHAQKAIVRDHALVEGLTQLHRSELTQYTIDRTLLSKEELNGKYKQHEIRWLEAAYKITKPNHIGLKTFEKALEKFGSNDKPYFIPFEVYKVGDRVMNTPSSALNAIRVQISTKDYAKAQKFFLDHADEEGIVIKPIKYVEGVANALKVRQPSYLHLIYGVDFESNFWTYYAKRSTKRKLSTHLAQVKISNQLLALNYSELTETNQEYLNLLRKFVGLDMLELDPTL